MSVQFEEENKFNEGFARDVTPSGNISKWLIKNKFAKDDKSAQKLMLIITVVCFAVAIYFAVK
jgi:hypothetical protein